MTYDSWKTTEPDSDYDRAEDAVFTETEVAALIEEMRAKCEAIARLNPFAHALNIANDIAKLRRS